MYTNQSNHMTDFSTKASKSATIKEIPPADASTTQVPEATSKDKHKDKPKYSKEELLSIFDEMIFSEEYVEEVSIRGKLKVSFRTRTADEISEITKILDGSNSNWVSTINEQRSFLNLCYGLASYQGKSLASVPFEEKKKILGKLPGPTVGALITALGEFDDKVFQACREGEENF